MAKLEVLVVCHGGVQVVKECDYLEYKDEGESTLALYLENTDAPVPVPSERGSKAKRGFSKTVAVFAAGAWLYAIPRDLSGVDQRYQGQAPAGYPNQIDPRTGQPIGQADQLGNYPNQPNQGIDPRTGRPIV